MHRLRRQFDARQHRRHALLQLIQHRVEQRERLGLVFVQRIALAIGAQADALAQMVERIQMLLPHRVQRLDQQRLLDEAHQLGAHVGRLRRHHRVRRLLDPLAQMALVDAFLAAPFLDRQIEVQHAPQIVGQFRQFPLLGERLLRHPTQHHRAR